MIQVTDREIIGSIHMNHWLKVSQTDNPYGPDLKSMLNSVVIYYPETREVVVDTPQGESYELYVDNEDLVTRILRQGEINLGMNHTPGTTRWISYVTGGGTKEALSMYIGNGIWLTEDSEHVWFYNIEALWEVDVEISQSQS